MNGVQLFKFESQNVRVVIKDGEPWFVGKDVADALGYERADNAIRSHVDKEDKLMHQISASGQRRNMTIINESGLYSLILSSKLESAKKFKRWITNEVLPTIRKTGGYVANEEVFINTYLPFADEQTRLMFRGVLETVRRQNEKIALMKPKTEYFDELVDRNLLTNFRDTAKELHIGPKTFVQWLIDNKYIYRDQKKKLKPYAQYVPELFQLKEWARNGKTDVQTLVTPKGRETFRLLLKKEEVAQ